MTTTKRSIYIDGGYQWNVTYHKTGEMIANSAWFDNEQEADDFLASLTEAD